MKRYVIIVAGGSGTRMGAEIPKQFLPLSGKPLLMYTLESFAGHLPEINTILVLPESHISYWEELCNIHGFELSHKVIPGGLIRGESVRNGLDAIADSEALVAIHDGVRPFAGYHTIEKAYELASSHGTAVPGREVTDTVRIIENGQNRPFDRKMIRSIQTPQCFRLSILREAYNVKNLQGYTDDAGLVGNLGYNIHLFEGNPENIKITTPFDLLIAESIIRNRKC
ncbi:MAG: 2-C-methyl-D-erythritol 4-phosphate cytidylyltransferase [Bacteroidetes bacterium]|nr:MAG: 2-C-methyl-D-erythritol 4-phosphate cytidylyltransferase [Bacteroidota bacterium]